MDNKEFQHFYFSMSIRILTFWIILFSFVCPTKSTEKNFSQNLPSVQLLTLMDKDDNLESKKDLQLNLNKNEIIDSDTIDVIALFILYCIFPCILIIVGGIILIIGYIKKKKPLKLAGIVVIGIGILTIFIFVALLILVLI